MSEWSVDRLIEYVRSHGYVLLAEQNATCSWVVWVHPEAWQEVRANSSGMDVEIVDGARTVSGAPIRISRHVPRSVGVLVLPDMAEGATGLPELG